MTLKNFLSSILSFSAKILRNPLALVIWTLCALIVPNITLDVTENSTWLWKIANIAFPLGAYTLLLSLSRKAGTAVLMLLPFMILGAFQIVLIYLYGESIIAVDMFLNVVTTNVSEATELLANLLAAIITVVLLYLPPIVWAIVAICRNFRLTNTVIRKLRTQGVVCTVAGIILIIAGTVAGTDNTGIQREIFPINVIDNLIKAVERTEQTANYPQTSARFTYQATSTRTPGEREIYIFAIGETSRAMNWELAGYERPTNPRLKEIPNLYFFGKSLSESNTTHKSVPMLMSFASSENFDSICHYKSILTAMKEAGFHTHFLSNQAPNRSYTEFFGDEADEVHYSDFAQASHPYDHSLLAVVEKAIADTLHPKQFIVMHTYGSHFLYRDRYPEQFARFLPDDAIDATPANREILVNAYDNSILCTDALLADAIALLDSAHCHSALFYSADHGEDIFDDKRERFLHASPHPTYYQLHVASLVWLSDSIINSYPAFAEALGKNKEQCVSPQKSMFNTAMETAGVTSPKVDYSKSLVNNRYRFDTACYLTDLNKAVPLEKSGLKRADIDNIHRIFNQ